EEVRRVQWAWEQASAAPAVACMVERFPAGMNESVVRELRALEAEGHPIVVFAMEQSTEARPSADVEGLRASVRIVRGPGGMGARARLAGHALLVLRRPWAY